VANKKRLNINCITWEACLWFLETTAAAEHSLNPAKALLQNLNTNGRDVGQNAMKERLSSCA